MFTGIKKQRLAMALSKQEFATYIKQFQFRELFNDMGWNNDRTKVPVTPDEQVFSLQAVAEKSGFRIFLCPPDPDGTIPCYNTRKKIETQVTKLYQEHLIIFTDRIQEEQIWQLAIRETGKPLKVTETRYNIDQDPELLYQRAAGLFFELDEEERITIVDVKQRVTANFHQNAEKVTKKFYEKFKKEHTAFLGFIKNIETKTDKDWYASLMLNRLMFCYFIQKKGFLDDNKNYLRDKLKACQEKKGDNKFYSFYKDFLMVLFHEGLNELHQKEEVQVEIGRIPFLNGGLFDEHELEKNYKDIDIDDKAFERVFDFFDEYEWHLDTRVTATGKDINPDVIGYIFEKYINDRAQMGAYYTKEDITEYISKNTILPWLFDETKRKYPNAFDPDGEILQRIKDSGDDYIYDAVKHGIPGKGDLFDDLPDEIKAGFRPDLEKKEVVAEEEPHLWQIRKPWNQKAPANIALPTEIYREVIERRKRYAEVKSNIESGNITQINDFITYNLNIRQFAQDVIENTSDPVFLRHFYKALNKVTVLDPTCGSGAFLFAAMNILEPLYQACLMRMRAFVEEEDRLNEAEKRSFKNQHKFFREVLAETQNEHHPNLQYFIYKSIILNNLYGVDIMKEAVEIAKLRLFLKLVATVDADYRKHNLGLEPLPDIDFNIRAGNTLVGFATEKELEKALVEDLLGAIVKQEIEEKCDIVARAFSRYKEIQLSTGDDYKGFGAAKNELNQRLQELNMELNLLLAKQYGVDIPNKKDLESGKSKFNDWLASHQPFHWFAEFYEIVHEREGFDVVIGNPPYVEYSKINYRLNGYKTQTCGNLYAYVVERSINIAQHNGYFGMIVPISSVCTNRMISYQKLISKNITWNSLFAERPSKLFTGAEVQLVISISKLNNQGKLYSTSYTKWPAQYRKFLFLNIQYTNIVDLVSEGSFPKIGSTNEIKILSKISNQHLQINNYKKSNSKFYVSYRNAGGRYYKVVLNFEPKFKVNKIQKRSSTYQFLYFENEEIRDSICALMNSSLFFWYWLILSDTWHMVNREIGSFPVLITDELEISIGRLNLQLMQDFSSNSEVKVENRNKGRDIVEFSQFNARKSKHIIDEIDQVLAEHYGFTEEELDFIINYDIKYRMGKELGNE